MPSRSCMPLSKGDVADALIATMPTHLGGMAARHLSDHPARMLQHRFPVAANGTPQPLAHHVARCLGTPTDDKGPSASKGYSSRGRPFQNEGSARVGITTICTLAVPKRYRPRTVAAPHDRSIIRFRVNGPRSLIVTTTVRPLRMCDSHARPEFEGSMSGSEAVRLKRIAVCRFSPISIVRGHPDETGRIRLWPYD